MRLFDDFFKDCAFTRYFLKIFGVGNLDMQVAFLEFLLGTLLYDHSQRWILVTWRGCFCSCSSSTPFILAKAVADVAKEINDPESMWPHSPTKSTAARNGLAKF